MDPENAAAESETADSLSCHPVKQIWTQVGHFWAGVPPVLFLSSLQSGGSNAGRSAWLIFLVACAAFRKTANGVIFCSGHKRDSCDLCMNE